MSKRKLLTISILILIGIFIIMFSLNENNEKQVTTQNQELCNQIKELISKNNEVNFEELTDFEWDEMYIIRPYTNPKEFLENNNVEWKTIETQIKLTDNINLIVFVESNKIISHVNLERKYGDFSIKSSKIDREKAVFNTSRETDEIILLDIKE